MFAIIRAASFVAAVAFTLPAIAADPLPKGAKARLGSTRLRDLNGWSNAVLSPDGKFLVVQSPQGVVKFDLATGEPAGMLGTKSPGFERRIEFSADGGRTLGVTYSSVSVWETESGKALAEVKRPVPFGEGAGSLAADGKSFAVGANMDFNAKDKPLTVLVWDVEKNAKIAEVAVVQNQSAYVALAPDGKTFATWGTHFERNPPKEGVEPANDPNRIVQIWETASGKELAKLRAEGFGSPHVAFSPDGQTLAVASGSGTVRLLEAKTGTERRRLFGRSDSGSRLAFSPDGKTLAVGGQDGAVQLWNIADGSRAGVIECPIGNTGFGLRGLSFTAPDRGIAWTAVGLTAFAWELPSGKLITPAGGHVSFIRSIAFASEGKEILTSGDDGLIFRWDPSGKELGEIRPRSPGFGSNNRYPMYQTTLTADGKTAMSPINQLGIFEVATGRQIAAPQSGLGFDSRAYLCQDARTLLLVPGVPFPPKPQPKTIRIAVWDLATGMKLAELETPPCEVSHAAVSPDRTKLATLTITRAENKSAFHATGWELATGKQLGEFTEAGGFNTTHFAIAPDNASVLTSTPSGKLLAIGLADGKVVREIETNRRGLTAHPAFAPGGKQFALAMLVGFGAGAASEVVLYDWESGKPAGKFRGGTGGVTALAFSPDGKTLAAASSDTTVLLWDVAAAEQ